MHAYGLRGIASCLGEKKKKLAPRGLPDRTGRDWAAILTRGAKGSLDTLAYETFYAVGNAGRDTRSVDCTRVCVDAIVSL